MSSHGGGTSKRELSVTIFAKVASVVVGELAGKIPIGGSLVGWAADKAIGKGATKLKEYLRNKKAESAAAVDVAKYDTLTKVEGSIKKLKTTVPAFQKSYEAYEELLQKAAAHEKNPSGAVDAEAYLEGLLSTWEAMNAQGEEISADLHGVTAYFAVWTDEVTGFTEKLKELGPKLQESLAKMVSTDGK